MSEDPAAMPNFAVGPRDVIARPSGLRLSAAISAPGTLEQLLARIAGENDQTAFAHLYSATKGKLFSTVLLVVRRRDLVEDVIQEVYARIWLNAASYRSSAGSPMTWMITVARNLAIDSVRKAARESYADDAELLALPSDSPSAVETLEAAEELNAAIEQKQKMLHALQALDPIRRDLVIAAYLHGESRARLAKRAGVPVNTVKTWIRRAVLEIQDILRNTETRTAGYGRAHPASRRGAPAAFRTATNPPRVPGARTVASAV